MKNIYIIAFLLTAFLSNCQNTEKDSISLKDVRYGANPEQLIDIHLPAERDGKNKVFVLLHGGGWRKGSKENFSYMVRNLKKEFPNHAIVNINYRLATPENPAYPMQINDIALVIKHLKNKTAEYKISNEYAFIGSSAGAHLSLLYAYGFDKNNEVKAVCSLIGPVDFTDPSYTSSASYSSGMLRNLVGKDNTWENNPQIYMEVSPISHVTKNAPPTIMFHGSEDPLVPRTQGPMLKEKLDKFGIPNELYIYEGEKHGKWNDENSADIKRKMYAFMKKYFS
jgi:acetyl esterase/lipase